MFGATKLLILAVTGSLLTGGAFLALSGAPGGSDRGLDTDGDGLYDWLVVDMPLSADRADYYSVFAILGTTQDVGRLCGGYGGIPGPLPLGPDEGGTPIVTGGGGMPVPGGEHVSPISWAAVRQFFEAGDHTVTLAFRGTDIGFAGVDGPYKVQAFSFPDSYLSDMWRGGIQPGEPYPMFTPWEYTTGPYRAEEFEQPRFAIEFTGTYTDEGADTDGDGLYDWLVLRADVQVNLAGTYTFGGTLMTEGSEPPEPGWYGPRVEYVAFAYGTVDFAEGPQVLEMQFNGGEIWASGESGSFDFMASVFYGGDYYQGNVTVEPYPGPVPPMPWMPGDYDVYGDMLCGATNEYDHDAWEELVEPATFTGVFADRGEDYDGDGLYDVLAVDAEIEVTQPTYRELDGTLMSGDGSAWITMDWQSTYFDVGTYTMTLRFAGPSIRASGVDGPYRADMNLRASYTYRTGQSATHTTAAYAWTDFDDDGWGGNGTRSHWIADLQADASTISVLVQRGNDDLAYVVDDTLTVTAYAEDGSVAFEVQDKVSLPSGGSTQSFTYSWSPTPGMYAVVATLGNGDVVRIAVTV